MIKKKWFKKVNRKKEPIYKNRFFWFLIIILATSATVFYLVCFYSFFKIKEVKVFGNQKVSTEDINVLIEEEISKDIFFLESKSIFLMDLRSIDQKILDKFPKIDRVDFDRDFPDKLIVSIKEREPVAVFKRGGNYFFIDNRGVIFEKIPESENGHWLTIEETGSNWEVGLGKSLIKEKDLSKILKIKLELEGLNFKIHSLEVVENQRVNVKLSEGWKVYFNFEDEISRQVLNLNLVLKEKILPEERENLEYVDLRFGNQIYYK